jgi:hypothetical protein
MALKFWQPMRALLTCKGRTGMRSDDQHEIWWLATGGPVANPSDGGSMALKFRRPMRAPMTGKERTGARSGDQHKLWWLVTRGPTANPSGGGSIIKLI